jgi:Ca2+-binding EF-hand superfamily protein
MSDALRRVLSFGTTNTRKITEEVKSAILTTFYQSDSGHKGYLTCQDVKVAILALFGYKPTKVEVNRLLQNETVTLKDGSTVHGLTLDRFVSIMSSKMTARDEDEHIRQMFLAFDMQCRGFVTCDDLKKVFSIIAPHMPVDGIKSAFRELDRDGDGRVSYKDFDFAMKYNTENHF